MAKKTKKRTFKRPVLGDIVEIPLTEGKGFAYAQYVNNHTAPPQYGTLLRILPGIYPERLKDFSEIVTEKELYYVFFPLGGAVSRKIVTLVSNEEIPEKCRNYPLFKSYNSTFDPETKKWRITYWYVERFLPDGNIEYVGERFKKLPKKYYELSMAQCVNDTLLIERIEKGWLPQDEVINP